MTNVTIERMLMHDYPNSMRHFQQLIMDAERCAKSYGKKGWFGQDKFAPAREQFQKTLSRCMVGLLADDKLANLDDPIAAIDEIDRAMRFLRMAYDKWPDAFSFLEKFSIAYRLNPPRV